MNDSELTMKNQTFAIRRDYRSYLNQQQNLLPSIPSKKIKSNNTDISQPSSNFYETIESIPTIQLTNSQMNSDPLSLFIELQSKYKHYGGVKLVTSQGWNPPFTFRYVDKGITTRIQNLYTLKYGKPFEQKIQAYTIRQYEMMAKDFQKNYTFRTNPVGSTLESKMQMEYWNLVSNPNYQTNSKKDFLVQYAADLSSTKYGSGFPTVNLANWKDSDFEYESNFFNLNNVFKSPLSMLKMCQKRGQKISGITAPWIYMGMQFSTFCWHVEDLWINSLNYNHKGGMKTWYFIPQSDKQKFDAFIHQKYNKVNNKKKKNLLKRLTLMEDPKQLIKNNIKVYKAYQNPRQYICTFFKAYHCGFSQSFNIGQAVNYISPKSIPFIQNALIYQLENSSNKPFVIPFEWLIYQNIQNVEQFGKYSQIIQESYQTILKQEYQNISVLIKNTNIKSVQLVKRNIKYDKNLCNECKNYVYLTFIKCLDCGKKYCFKHFTSCCNANYSLAIRELNQDRKNLREILPSLSQFIQSQNTCITQNYTKAD